MRLREKCRLPFFDDVRDGGLWCLKFRQYVGAIALPGKRTLEILPKIGTSDNPAAVRCNLMHMLACTGIMPSLEGDLSLYSESANLTEAYLRAIARMAWSLVHHQGVPKDYRRQDLTTPFLKGRWQVSRQITRHAGRYDRHDVNLDLFTADTAANRVLKGSMRMILSAAAAEETRRLSRSLVFLLGEISDAPFSVRACDELHFDRRNSSWEPLFLLISQFLKRQLSDVASGADSAGPAWLFDMNEVFESYLAWRIKRLSRHRVTVQGPSRWFVKAGAGKRYRLLPDIVIGPLHSPHLIIDAKWKRLGAAFEQSVSVQDLRQVYTYGKIYRVPKVLLIYPASMEPAREIEFESNEVGGSPVRITIGEVSVGIGKGEEMDSQLRRLLRTDDSGRAGLPG